MTYNIEVGEYNEAEFTQPTDRCPHPQRWHTRDVQTAETEVVEMVAGLIRGLQPTTVLETGTSRGFMALAIGNALEANGQGILHTYEPDNDIHAEAEARVTPTNVILHNRKSMVPWHHGQLDFCWFDSLVELRVPEFKFYSQYMHAGTVVGFHDTAPHFGGWANELWRLPNLAVIGLPTPRGVVLGRFLP